MADPAKMPATEPVLEVAGLEVHYGHAHALQGVSFSLESGVLAELTVTERTGVKVEQLPSQ